MPVHPSAGRDATVADAVEVLLEVVDDLLVRGARDTHYAVADRVHRVSSGLTRGVRGPRVVHDTVAGGVYAGVGMGVRLAAKGAGALAHAGGGARLDDHRAGRQLRATLNGLIGDRLAEAQRPLAIAMAPRVDGRDVVLARPEVARAYPAATDRIAVFLHGLVESESAWQMRRDERGSTYPEDLAAIGWTPVMLRMNSGVGLRPNGVALASLLDDLVDAWPTPVARIALIGHSMGGLVIRAAGALVEAGAWAERVSDVITLGTPHRGAPLAGWAGHGSSALGGFAESAAVGRVLDSRSVGIRDLVDGLGDETPLLPHAHYRLVSGTITRSARHPVGAVLGDLMVREGSAYGRGARSFDDVFAESRATTLHVGRAGHLALLNHPTVAAGLRDWLA